MRSFLKRLFGRGRKVTWRNARTWAEWQELERRGEVLILADRGTNIPTIYRRPGGWKRKK